MNTVYRIWLACIFIGLLCFIGVPLLFIAYPKTMTLFVLGWVAVISFRRGGYHDDDQDDADALAIQRMQDDYARAEDGEHSEPIFSREE